MMLFLVTFLIISAAMLAMAIGVMSGGRRIKGSCGGLSQGPGEQPGCNICGANCVDADRPTLR